jgi:endonuclease YncB( thermonuclease family)
MQYLKILFFLILPFTISAQIYTGKIISVKDGDSFELLTKENQIIEIRLAHVDTPEKKQPYGKAAKIYAANLVWGYIVTATQTDTDRYKRKICIVEANGRILNLELVRVGLAWHFKKYSEDPRYARAEKVAKARKVGLWKQSNPIAPWDARKRKR